MRFEQICCKYNNIGFRYRKGVLTISLFFAVVFLILLSSALVNPLPDCATSYYPLLSNQRITVSSPNYPCGFPVPSRCQFTVAAPIFHSIVATCYYYIGVKMCNLKLNQRVNICVFSQQARSSNCDPNDSLYVQTDGTTNLANSNARIYCGSGQYLSGVVTSFNSITIGG